MSAPLSRSALATFAHRRPVTTLYLAAMAVATFVAWLVDAGVWP